MGSRRPVLFYFTVLLVIVSVLVQETEARRKILRGRKTLTRRYYRGGGIPAWAITLIVGIGMLLVGGVLYGVMRKMVLSAESGSMNTYQPALQNDVP